MDVREARRLQTAPLDAGTDLKPEAVQDISGAMNILLADMFALYVKTKNFHWHVSGAHFRDYHLLLDEQGDQIFATTDASPNVFERLATSPFTPSVTSAACSACWTTTQITSRP